MLLKFRRKKNFFGNVNFFVSFLKYDEHGGINGYYVAYKPNDIPIKL